MEPFDGSFASPEKENGVVVVGDPFFLYKREKLWHNKNGKKSFPNLGKEVSQMDTKAVKKTVSNCETCVFYDYDDYFETYSCRQNLDEDENLRFLAGAFRNCPYYKFYDEYKSVQKQN